MSYVRIVYEPSIFGSAEYGIEAGEKRRWGVAWRKIRYMKTEEEARNEGAKIKASLDKFPVYL